MKSTMPEKAPSETAVTEVELRGVTVRFGHHTAVDELSFTLHRGECTILLGLNGAGKSTTMRVLTGLLAPDAGTVRLFGADPLGESIRARRSFGYLPEEGILDGQLTLREHLELVGALHRMTPQARRERSSMLVERLSLAGVLDRPVGGYSRGFRQRASLAVVLLHDPAFVILDEPVTGLDPEQQTAFHELIKEMARDRVMLLSTHLLSEARQLADRVLVLASGRCTYDGPMAGDERLRTALIGEGA
ncbi:MAG: multidrug ABC transporter ATP-binding protein [Deltaproteobacteria bacterium HGW-Deltaproteobacteria-17]|nr:MAG: multidrug ABC transporter ATP-binding protein [Deltaproteobacteria bacterium HGW-Deltaproteobacteria-17]